LRIMGNLHPGALSSDGSGYWTSARKKLCLPAVPDIVREVRGGRHGRCAISRISCDARFGFRHSPEAGGTLEQNATNLVVVEIEAGGFECEAPRRTT
jgi:hypothetical protein